MDRGQLIEYLFFFFFFIYVYIIFFNPVVFCTFKPNARLFTRNYNVMKLDVEG